MIKNRALLLDRDGVINKDAGYVGTLDRFVFLDGLFPFLRKVQDLGFRLAIVTNQSGVARGLFPEDDYRRLTDHMFREFAKQEIALNALVSCFEYPEGTVQKFARESYWRKPNPGMILEVIRRLDLDPKECALLGDSLRDMDAAKEAQIGKCLWLGGISETTKGVIPVKNFDEALKFLS